MYAGAGSLQPTVVTAVGPRWQARRERDVGVKLVSGGMGEREVERPMPALAAGGMRDGE